MIHGRTIRSTIPRGRVLAAGATIDEAARVLSREIAPIDDLRSTAEYRMRVATNLLRRFWIETG